MNAKERSIGKYRSFSLVFICFFLLLIRSLAPLSCFLYYLLSFNSVKLQDYWKNLSLEPAGGPAKFRRKAAKAFLEHATNSASYVRRDVADAYAILARYVLDYCHLRLGPLDIVVVAVLRQSSAKEKKESFLNGSEILYF